MLSENDNEIAFAPHHQLGYINPVNISDFIHYQFYQIAPPQTHFVAYHINLQSFSKPGVETALEAFPAALDFLIKRKVERISLGGIPLSAFAGRQRILELLDGAKQRTGIPVTTDFEESVEALQHLGVTKVAATAKWDEPLMEAVCTYLKHAGMEVVGSFGEAHSAQQVMALDPNDSVGIGLQIGRETLRRFPEADGVLLAGGAWLVLPVVPMLEAEFGKPVVNNPLSSYWAGFRQLGIRSPKQGLGMLLDSLHSQP